MKPTPMMQQYLNLKEQYPDALLFFRLGDFYEMFGEDAKVGSKLLEITLTSREAGVQGRIPMCGVPHHAVQGYLDKLIRAGHKVALCEQLEDPKDAKGVVKRDVVRVITPGTFLEGEIEGDQAKYLVALATAKRNWGLALLELSTAEFKTTALTDWAALQDELLRLQPVEIVVPAGFPHADQLGALADELGATLSTVNSSGTRTARSSQVLLSHFEVATLAPFGLSSSEEILAAGLVLEYVKDTHRGMLSHIRTVSSYRPEQFLQIDGHSRQNLELTQTIRGQKKSGSLLGILDHTVTSMGARLLRSFLEKPLLDLELIRQRHDQVESLVEHTALRLDLSGALEDVYDLERLVGRLAAGSGNARDLRALASSLERIPLVQALFANAENPLLTELVSRLDPLSDFTELIARALVEAPALVLREGNLIRDGYNAELDHLRQAHRGGKQWIQALERGERERTGIKSLKVGFNRVFGYYIEVTNANAHLVPPEYQRRQTLANAERYITPELKEQESLVLGADERICELEYQLFLELRKKVEDHVEAIQQNAAVLACLDVLQSLAKAAVLHRFVRPEMSPDPVLELIQSRHPVIEAQEGQFVPNDLLLDRVQQIILLTGPNMAGKSTYLRQVALIVIMAQMGGFIPAQSGKIGVVDRIFTRIGASDDLSMGQSTFMVECSETAGLLLNATRRSLIILDELGRGTSTFDGMAIAQAVIEYIHAKVQARTLFSTHFHELTKLESTLKRVVSYRVEVEERAGQIYFLHRVSRGSTDRSYGINVARMAGMPGPVIRRSLQLLEELETGQTGPLQLDLFQSLAYQATALDLEPAEVAPSELERELLALDLDNITPLEALQKLILWQQKVLKEDS